MDKVTILIVEDDVNAANMVEDMIVLAMGTQKFEIIRADHMARVDEVLEDRKKIDLIVWDGSIKGGMTTGGAIEKAHAKFPICIMLAASGEEETIDIQMMQGCSISLRKPMEFEKLRYAIQQLFVSDHAVP